MKKHQADREAAENAGRLRYRKIYRVLFAVFFVAMFLFTILSRILDSYNVPKVSTAYPRQSGVVSTVSGDGVVEAEEMKRIPAMEGLVVERVEAGPGAEVKKGDPLFYYEADSLLKKRSELVKEIRKLELANEAERLGVTSHEGVTNVELAAQELQAAARAFERQQEKTRQAQEEYAVNMEELETYYDKRLDLTEEELLEQSRLDYHKSMDAYDTLQMERDADLKSIGRKIKDTEKKIRKLEDKEDPGEADEERLEELELLLEQYEADLELADDKWDLALEQAEDDRNFKEDIFDRADRGSDLTRLELEENYKSAAGQEEKNLEAALEKEKDSGLLLEKAQQALENAKRNDQAKALNEDQARRLSELHCQSAQLDIDEKKEELKDIEELIGNGGAVTAPVDGITALSELETGKKTAGTERFLLSVGSLRLKGSFDQEENPISAGDEVEARLDSGELPITAVVTLVDLVTDGKERAFYAKLPKGKGTLGQSISYECIKKTDLMPTVIPSSAVRKDTNGEYCLVLRTYKTIMGEEYRAARVDLKLVFKGDSQTAVEGPLTQDDRVITASDRVVTAGDRVRPIMELQNGK